MKTSFLTLVAAVLLAGSAQAQKLAAAQVPAVAVATFQKNFPTVKTVKWEKEGADYEAGFDMGKVNAEFFPDGRFEVDFLCNLGYADHSKEFPRNPRLSFEQVATVL